MWVVEIIIIYISPVLTRACPSMMRFCLSKHYRITATTFAGTTSGSAPLCNNWWVLSKFSHHSGEFEYSWTSRKQYLGRSARRPVPIYVFRIQFINANDINSPLGRICCRRKCAGFWPADRKLRRINRGARRSLTSALVFRGCFLETRFTVRR